MASAGPSFNFGSYQLFGSSDPLTSELDAFFKREKVEPKETKKPATEKSENAGKKILGDKEDSKSDNGDNKSPVTRARKLSKEAKCFVPQAVENFIPNIHLDTKRMEAHYHQNRRFLTQWKLSAKWAEKVGDYTAAMLAYKTICEITVHEPYHWRNLLLCALAHFKEAVPGICEKILFISYDKHLRDDAKKFLQTHSNAG